MGRMEPGTLLASRYRVQRFLRRSTIGDVFLAEALDTGDPVEIKLLGEPSVENGESPPEAGASQARLGARLRREARAAASIRSEHVQRVIELVEDAGRGPLLVYEWREGESLLERLERQGPMPLAELHPIIEGVWLGLGSVHAAGVVHRDLKHSNVLLARDGDGPPRVVLRGLDLCKITGSGDEITEMGMSLGGFSFMPPEQIGKSKTVDHRADVYACATLVFQALTGQLPYAARNILVMVEMKTKYDARTLGQVMGGPVDPRLEAFVARGLARDPARRFPSALDALRAWQELGRPG
jgi:serine/threonine-protein kinase